MRLYFIFNPYAGKGILKTKLFSIIKIFSSAGYAVEVFPTEQKGDATAKAFEICNAPCAYDLIVCAGGDGTLNEVLQGIMQSDRKIPVGYIPTGTSNDFARSIGIPFQVEKAAELAVTGRPFQNDIGQFNDNFFTYLAAFGAFANVSYDASQAMKNNLGYIAYFLEALKCIKEIKGYKISIEYDDGIIDGEYAYGMVTNSSSVGKYLKQKNIVLDDGVFEVTLIHQPADIFELQMIIQSLLDLNSDVNNKMVTSFKTKNIIFRALEPIKWTIDGEYGGTYTNVAITNIRRALSFIHF